MAATAALGVLLFREHLPRAGWLGVAGIAGAGALLSIGEGWPGVVAGLLVAGACVCWGLDNHLTALIDAITPARSTLWKGAAAGAVNLAIGIGLAPFTASWSAVAAALLVGGLSYGVSIALYIASAQQLGATRAQGLFASAPFLGAGFAFALLDESFGITQLVAGCLLLGSVALLFLSLHEHEHVHEPTEHVHSHRHDDGHHTHAHPDLPPSTRHTHWHRHKRRVHAHPHWPDIHHRHEHAGGGES